MSDFKPTREQIIEGRDEALEHLRILVPLWESMSHNTRQSRMIVEASRTSSRRAAAMTVASAEKWLAEGLGGISWQATVLKIAFINPRRQSDYVLQA